MPLHIDFYENDWSAGQQHRVASLEVVKGTPTLTESVDKDKWTRVLEVNSLPRNVGYGADQELLSRLSKRYQGDYVFATEPHDAAECEYPKEGYFQGPKEQNAAQKAKRTAARN